MLVPVQISCAAEARGPCAFFQVWSGVFRGEFVVGFEMGFGGFVFLFSWIMVVNFGSEFMIGLYDS